MEPELVTPSSPSSFLGSHPIIPISLTLSIAAIALGIVSMSRLSQASPTSQDGFTPIDTAKESTNSTLSVDVEGQVAHPGIVTIEIDPGKPPRIADILRSVGGLLDTADQDYIQKNMNLAAIVTDGMKLYVPGKGEKTQAVGLGAVRGSATVHINSASLEDIKALKGIGEARALVLFDNRPYASFDDLVKRTKLPISLLEKIKNDIDF